MQSAKRREDEAESLEALRSLQVLDSEPEPDFDALARAASLACGVPIALISLVDAARQWFQANIGLPGLTETPREVSFCAHAILSDGLFIVPDAVLDPRFADNPLVTGDPNIRFYAGAPIRLSDGHRIGTLCVVDRKPRELDATQREILQCLAMAAARALEWRRASCELLAQRQRMANIIDGTDVGTWEWNVATGELRINERFARIVGRVIDDWHATTNHGIGIATANLPQLFTNFHQLSVGDAKTHEGTGLGLALVRRLVESQGGTVGVRSALGVGSVFPMIMPCQGRALPA